MLLGLVSIIVLGIGATWLAWRLHLPSILLLLVFGLLAGPVTGLLNPDALFGDLLLPIVSLAVAIILFEGGLNLRLGELRKIGGVVRNLVTAGILVSWAVGSCAAYFILNLDLPLAVLLGAILVVTGPTVIMPLLRYLRPKSQIASILKWEGIIIDPIGAILAVLIFEIIIAGGFQQITAVVGISLLGTLLVGIITGILGAGIVVLLLRSYWVPDFLHSAVTLTMVIAIYAVADVMQPESGLLAATIMGIALANQKSVGVKHIIEFKENLSVLLISSLFIMLAARLQVNDLAHLGISSLAFIGILIFVARPAAVALSTIKSKLTWKERLFLSSLAPRGIVAAAISSVFALQLLEAGYSQAEQLVPLTFAVVAGTVAIYGLSASPIARWLGVAEPNPQGMLIVGGHSWARSIASALQAEGYKVLVIDVNWANISAARMAGLPTFYANILSQYAVDEIELGGIGRMLALTYDDEFNSLAVLQFANVFGRSESYQLLSESEKNDSKKAVSSHLHGRILFGPGISYTRLSNRFSRGAIIKTTTLSEEFDYKAFQKHYGESAIPMFLIEPNGNLRIFTADNPLKPRADQKIISIVDPEEKA